MIFFQSKKNQKKIKMSASSSSSSFSLEEIIDLIWKEFQTEVGDSDQFEFLKETLINLLKKYLRPEFIPSMGATPGVILQTHEVDFLMRWLGKIHSSWCFAENGIRNVVLGVDNFFSTFKYRHLWEKGLLFFASTAEVSSFLLRESRESRNPTSIMIINESYFDHKGGPYIPYVFTYKLVNNVVKITEQTYLSFSKILNLSGKEEEKEKVSDDHILVARIESSEETKNDKLYDHSSLLTQYIELPLKYCEFILFECHSCDKFLRPFREFSPEKDNPTQLLQLYRRCEANLRSFNHVVCNNKACKDKCIYVDFDESTKWDPNIVVTVHASN